MSLSKTAGLLLASTALVAGHGYVTSIDVDGTTYGGSLVDTYSTRTWWRALTLSTIFTCICILDDDYDQAQVHFASGYNLIRQFDDPTCKVVPEKEQEKPPVVSVEPKPFITESEKAPAKTPVASPSPSPSPSPAPAPAPVKTGGDGAQKQPSQQHNNSTLAEVATPSDVPIAGGIPLRIMFIGASMTLGTPPQSAYRMQLREWLVSLGNPVNCVGAVCFHSTISIPIPIPITTHKNKQA